MKRIIFLVILLNSFLFYVQAKNRYSLLLNSYSCFQDETDGNLFYSIKENEELDMQIKYDEEYVSEFYIEGQRVLNSEIYLFKPFKEKKNYQINFLLKDNSQVQSNLIFTILPIISINSNNQEIIKDSRTTCDFKLFDPYARTNDGLVAFTHKGGIKVRGASASSKPKKSYSVELQDENGEEYDASLLGIRLDGDWILDAMYIDRARMRNRLCMDIWNSFNNVPYSGKEPEACNGTRGYFVEVFLNGIYNGLYCLSDRVDRKQLKVKKDYNTGGIMFKAISWNSAVYISSYDKKANRDELIWCGWESEYPGLIEYLKWDYLMNFIDFVQYSSKDTFASKLNEYVYIDNIIDYIIFLNAIYAQDNNMKNTFLSIYNLKNDYRLFITPWDLDATLGRSWRGDLLEKYGFSDNLTYSNYFFKRLFEEAPNGFYTDLKSRWNELKNDNLSVATISERIDAYRDLFHYSEAAKREQKRWPDSFDDILAEANFMKQWYSKNYEIIDNYITNLSVGVENSELNAPIINVSGSNIMIEWNSQESFDISIYQVSGVELLTQKANIITTTIEVSSPGIYILKLSANSGQMITRKISIHK